MGAKRGVQQYAGGRDVVRAVFFGIGDRFGDQRERGEVNDGIDALAREQRFDERAVADAALREGGAGIDRGAVAGAQIIDHDDAATLIEELVHYDTADVPCPTRDEHACRHSGGSPGAFSSRPNNRRSASSNPYPRPCSAATFNANVG